MNIRPAEPHDRAAIAAIILPIIRAGRVYALDAGMSEAEALDYWLGADKTVFVAQDGAGRVVGTYYLRPNQRGGGAHVCNAGYATAGDMEGRGIGRGMGAHSLAEARARGYRAMQFNFVVSTNAAAVRLWQSLGFGIVGRLPGAFRDPAAGYVDAFVMVRAL